MRAAHLLALATAFVGSSLLALVGCGGDSSVPSSENPDIVPAILVAPARIATLQDGGKIMIRTLPAGGGVEGQAIIFPPIGAAGERPLLLSVSGTATDMNLVSLAEKNDAVDYRLVGTMSADGTFDANLLAGPDASAGDEPPQTLDFSRPNRSQATMKPGRATEFATGVMRLFDGRDAYRFRFDKAKLIDDSFGLTYEIGYRLCLECTDKFTDYSAIHAQYFEESPGYITVFFFDKDGEVGWGTIDQKDGKFSFDSGTSEETFFVNRSPINDETEFGRFVNITGSVVILE